MKSDKDFKNFVFNDFQTSCYLLKNIIGEQNSYSSTTWIKHGILNKTIPANIFTFIFYSI